MRFSLLFILFLFLGFKSYAEISIEMLQTCICEGQTAQPFQLIATGTAGPFTFQWQGSNNYTSTQQNPDDITEAGTYTVLVTNAYECTVSLDANLSPCTPINSLDFELIQSCSDGTGTILTTVTDGVVGGGGYDFN